MRITDKITHLTQLALYKTVFLSKFTMIFISYWLRFSAIKSLANNSRRLIFLSKLSLFSLLPTLLTSCAMLDIGKSTFYCQDNPDSCNSASANLLKDKQNQLSSLDMVSTFNFESAKVKDLTTKPSSTKVIAKSSNLSSDSASSLTFLQDVSSYHTFKIKSLSASEYPLELYSGISSNTSSFKLINQQVNSYLQV